MSSTALRDQNDQTTNFYGNIPNVPLTVNPAITASGTVTPPFTITTPITLSPVDPKLREYSAAQPAAFTIQTIDFSNVPAPDVQQWNFTLQYQLGRSWLVEAAYAGARGTRLGARTNLNQVPFEYALEGRNTQAWRRMPKINGTGGYSAGDANNKYHAFNLRAKRRFSSGFNFLVNYTISKNLEIKRLR